MIHRLKNNIKRFLNIIEIFFILKFLGPFYLLLLGSIIDLLPHSIYHANAQEIKGNSEINNAYFFLYNQEDAFIEPEIEILNLKNQVEYLKEYRGKTVLLYFFATWCATCKIELQHIDKFAEEMEFLDINNLLILPISIDYKAISEIDSLFKTLGLKKLTPFLDQNKIAMKKLGVKTIPTNIIINNNGVIVSKTDKDIKWHKKEDWQSIIDLSKSEFIQSKKSDAIQSNENAPNIINTTRHKAVTIIN